MFWIKVALTCGQCLNSQKTSSTQNGAWYHDGHVSSHIVKTLSIRCIKRGDVRCLFRPMISTNWQNLQKMLFVFRNISLPLKLWKIQHFVVLLHPLFSNLFKQLCLQKICLFIKTVPIYTYKIYFSTLISYWLLFCIAQKSGTFLCAIGNKLNKKSSTLI